MSLEAVQGYAPEVVAPAADIGEVRSGGAVLGVAEAVPLALDESHRMAMGRGLGAGRDARDGHQRDERSEQAPAHLVRTGGRQQALRPGEQGGGEEGTGAGEQRRMPGASGGMLERGARTCLVDVQ